MGDDGKRGIYINNDATVTCRLTLKRITAVEGPKVHSVGQINSLPSRYAVAEAWAEAALLSPHQGTQQGLHIHFRPVRPLSKRTAARTQTLCF